jgi:hypothetical protein
LGGSPGLLYDIAAGGGHGIGDLRVVQTGLQVTALLVLLLLHGLRGLAELLLVLPELELLVAATGVRVPLAS